MVTPRIAVMAIVRNEAHYLLEWLAWHRALGVAHFYLCENSSDDGTATLLEALQRAGVLTVLPFPDPVGQRPQIPAYQTLLRRFGDRADWFCIIDADEFLAPDRGAGLADLLTRQDPACRQKEPADWEGLRLNHYIVKSQPGVHRQTGEGSR